MVAPWASSLLMLVVLGTTVVLLCITLATPTASGVMNGTQTRVDGARRVTVMPFGDSITTCCHACAVQAGVLPPDLRRTHAEPIQPFEGYVRPLWGVLRRVNASLKGAAVELVGRQTDCIFKLPNATRATTDWPVHFEGFYGYTTRRLVREGMPVSAVAHAMAATGRPPAIALLHVGTNDLIAVKTRNRIAGAVEGTRMLIEALALGGAGLGVIAGSSGGPPKAPSSSMCAVLASTIPPASSTLEQRGEAAAREPSGSVSPRRAIVLSLPIPVAFGNVAAGAQSQSFTARARRWRRHAALHTALESLFENVTNVHAKRRVVDRGHSPDAHSFVRGIGALQLRRSQLARLEHACCTQRGSSASECGVPPQPTAADAGATDDAEATVDAGVDVVLVDQAIGFAAARDLHGDGLHPNLVGEAKIAARYAAGIQAVLERWNALPRGAVLPDGELERAAAEAARAGLPYTVGDGAASSSVLQRGETEQPTTAGA